jgi:DNA-binding PadR family transcriptional regulator
MSAAYIGEFEELVLLAILKLAPDAYGTTIIEALADAGRKTSIGALYATLSRLEEKGLISSWMADPTAERGGRAKKYLKITADGEAAVRAAHKSRRKLAPSFGFGYEIEGVVK